MSQPRPTPPSAPSAAPTSAPGSVPVTVAVPAPLRALAGAGEVPVRAATAGAAIEALLDRCPALRRHLRTEAGALREHVNVFVNEEDIRALAGESTALSPSDVVTIVPSIAGG